MFLMFSKKIKFSLLLFISLPALAADPSAEKILEGADAIRNPSESFFMKVAVESTGVADKSVFEVYSKGRTKTLVRPKEPARDRGRNMLMVDEDMWVYIPNLNRAVRVSLSQKLTGQAANGDISRTRWSGDYTAEFAPADATLASAWCLDLKANKKGLTYERIRVWIQKNTLHPLKAEYLTAAGKVLKRATFGAYHPMAGAERPGELLIEDATLANEKSTLKILALEVRNNPDSMFNQNNLK